MKVILKSTQALLNRMPITLRELCSHFMSDSQDLEFDALIKVEELEDYDFLYLHIDETSDEFNLNTSKDYLTVDIETLNEMNNNLNDFQQKFNDDYADQAIHAYGEFTDAAEKLKKFYREHNNGRNTIEDVIDQFKNVYTINFDDYDIICIEKDSYLYDSLS